MWGWITYPLTWWKMRHNKVGKTAHTSAKMGRKMVWLALWWFTDSVMIGACSTTCSFVYCCVATLSVMLSILFEFTLLYLPIELCNWKFQIPTSREYIEIAGFPKLPEHKTISMRLNGRTLRTFVKCMSIKCERWNPCFLKAHSSEWTYLRNFH